MHHSTDKCCFGLEPNPVPTIRIDYKTKKHRMDRNILIYLLVCLDKSILHKWKCTRGKLGYDMKKERKEKNRKEKKERLLTLYLVMFVRNSVGWNRFIMTTLAPTASDDSKTMIA